MIMPGDWPYARHVYDQVSVYGEVAAAAQLAPDAGSREALPAMGWILRGGGLSKLFGRARDERMASA
jgi:hypothetical protein